MERGGRTHPTSSSALRRDTPLESYCLFNEFTLAAAIVQMGIYFHHLFCRICKPKCVFSLVRCHS